MNFIGRRFDSKPRGIERRQEQQDQHGTNRRAADQRIGHRSPEHGMRKRNEGQHGSECGQDHRPGTLHRGFDDSVIVMKAGGKVLVDLFGQD